MFLEMRRFSLLISEEECIEVFLPMMGKIAELRDKYDLHMRVERFLSDDGGVPEADEGFIRR